jgi:hypothetical protein
MHTPPLKNCFVDLPSPQNWRDVSQADWLDEIRQNPAAVRRHGGKDQ